MGLALGSHPGDRLEAAPLTRPDPRPLRLPARGFAVAGGGAPVMHMFSTARPGRFRRHGRYLR